MQCNNLLFSGALPFDPDVNFYALDNINLASMKVEQTHIHNITTFLIYMHIVAFILFCTEIKVSKKHFLQFHKVKRIRRTIRRFSRAKWNNGLMWHFALLVSLFAFAFNITDMADEPEPVFGMKIQFCNSL